MDVRTITPNVSVSGQIRPDDVAQLKAMGFRAIVGNRLDGEDEEQPAWAEIEEAARDAGLEAVHLPVPRGTIMDSQVSEFRDVVTGLPKPVLAFCATGNRSARLWALAARDRLSPDEVTRMTATAGYDIRDMRERIEKGA